MVEIVEVEGEGLEGLLGEKVTLFCVNYFYTGTLVGVNKEDVKLENPAIIYETGAWNTKEYSNVQLMGCKFLYVRMSAIESYGVIK